MSTYVLDIFLLAKELMCNFLARKHHDPDGAIWRLIYQWEKGWLKVGSKKQRAYLGGNSNYPNVV